MVTQQRRLWAMMVGLSLVASMAHADQVGSIVNGITAKAGAPIDRTQESGGRGREQKANNSQKGANTGAIIAAIAGASLVAAAVPKLASGIPSQIAIGSALMAKAGMEFAQSAASAKTGAENGGQYSKLTLAYDESKSSVNSQGPAEIQQQIANSLASNPELQNVLQGRGVDPLQFISQLSTGQLASSDAVLTAMKNDVPIDAGTMAQAEAAATAQTTRAVIEAMSKVNLQEGAQTSGVASASGSGGGTTVMAQSGNASSLGGDSKGPEVGAVDAAAPNATRAPSEADTGAGVGAKTNGGVGAGLGDIEDDLLQQLMSGFPGMPKKGEDTAVGEKERDPLMALGVRRPVGKMTLFQLAHRNFRSYREWRTKRMIKARSQAEAAKVTGQKLALKTAASR